MSFGIEYTRESVSDLNEIAQYLTETGLASPVFVLNRIRERIEGLRQLPFTGQVLQKRPRFRRLVIDRLPYAVYYEVREENNTVLIARVLHTARRQP